MWDVISARYVSEAYAVYIQERWEPFAATLSPHNGMDVIIWLKKWRDV